MCIFRTAKVHNLSLPVAAGSEHWQVSGGAPTGIKESRGTLRSYGPVNLTVMPQLSSIPSKIAEAMLKDSITEHMNKQSLQKTSPHDIILNRESLFEEKEICTELL